MEKYASEKATDGTLLGKMLDPTYFFIFGSFGLFWDAALNLAQGHGLLQLSYPSETPFPIGVTFLVIGAFSFFATVVAPIAFGIVNNLFWNLADILPFRVYFEDSSQNSDRRYSVVVYLRELKLWAIKEKNSQAMELVKGVEANIASARKNRINPFMLACCLLLNYYTPTNSVTKVIQLSLTESWVAWFPWFVITLSAILCYISFVAMVNEEFDVMLPGLKQLIENSKNDG